MKHAPPFVPSGVADKLVADDDAAARARGAACVALQLDNSFAFSTSFWLIVVVGAAVAWWLQSWVPVIVAATLIAYSFYKLIISASRQVAQLGILPEVQAAYKRLYYSDPIFRKQVGDIRASKK